MTAPTLSERGWRRHRVTVPVEHRSQRGPAESPVVWDDLRWWATTASTSGGRRPRDGTFVPVPAGCPLTRPNPIGGQPGLRRRPLPPIRLVTVDVRVPHDRSEAGGFEWVMSPGSGRQSAKAAVCTVVIQWTTGSLGKLHPLRCLPERTASRRERLVSNGPLRGHCRGSTTFTTAGGGDGNRTRVQGFADPCLNHSATPPGPCSRTARGRG